MKTFGVCATIGAVAFLLAAYQAGLFQIVSADVADEDPVIVAEEKPAPEKKPEVKKPPKARFPQDLSPAARAEPVAQAAELDTEAKFHKTVFLKTTGALHPWQEYLKEEWTAENVEETALVVVLGPQKKTFIEIIHYPNGAPPISRYKYEVEASIIAAKTGKVLANRQFINMPRNIQKIETWDTTALGSPVEFRIVFHWVASVARAGFPVEYNARPIINVVN